MRPKIISLTEINTVDPQKECFILKKAFAVEKCAEIIEFLNIFQSKYEPNQKIRGENWYYPVQMGGTKFNSFIFNKLAALNCSTLSEAYEVLFDIYQMLGEKTEKNDFLAESSIDDFVIDYKIINPLAFYYTAETSFFEFHKHDERNQKFQLLMNLTQPNVDYRGAETCIYIGDGKPNLNSLDIEKDCVIFGGEFEKGDIFSFPYHLWHRVNTPKKGCSGVDARVSLLMPIGRRNVDEYKNEYL